MVVISVPPDVPDPRATSGSRPKISEYVATVRVPPTCGAPVVVVAFAVFVPDPVFELEL